MTLLRPPCLTIPTSLPCLPPPQGAIGDLYNFHLDPSLTLGCGSWGSTSVSMNVGPKNMLNIKSVVERRENMLWFRIPPKVGAEYLGWCLQWQGENPGGDVELEHAPALPLH